VKPFEPTPSRLERARREGDHPISRDAVALAALCGSLLGLAASASLLRVAIPQLLRGVMAAHFGAQQLVPPLALTVAATCGCASGAAIVATLAQTRGPAPRALSFRLSWHRVFGRDAPAAIGRSALAALLGVAGVAAATRPQPDAVVRVLMIVVAVAAANAVADALAARAAWRRRLRMTHEELKRELREHEGDPQTRARRRRLHGTMLRGSIREVRRASFVVVNPAHVAVAVRYVPPETPVPAILVRAADEGALRVKALAREARIPTVEDPALARKLFAHALGPIAPELYVPVAQIIASLQR
jgi:flagellar biosynthesis protein FlhB